MEYRIEHDSMGEVQVPADRYWGPRPREVSRTSLLEPKRSPWK